MDRATIDALVSAQLQLMNGCAFHSRAASTFSDLAMAVMWLRSEELNSEKRAKLAAMLAKLSGLNIGVEPVRVTVAGNDVVLHLPVASRSEPETSPAKSNVLPFERKGVPHA